MRFLGSIWEHSSPDQIRFLASLAAFNNTGVRGGTVETVSHNVVSLVKYIECRMCCMCCLSLLSYICCDLKHTSLSFNTSKLNCKFYIPSLKPFSNMCYSIDCFPLPLTVYSNDALFYRDCSMYLLCQGRIYHSQESIIISTWSLIMLHTSVSEVIHYVRI